MKTPEQIQRRIKACLLTIARIKQEMINKSEQEKAKDEFSIYVINNKINELRWTLRSR